MHIMVDIETLGKHAGCIILSLGAVAFDPKDPNKAGETFYANIDPFDMQQYGFHTDPDTVEWWKGQSEEAKASLLVDRKPAVVVLKDFIQWFHSVRGEQIWSQGASFDIPIIDCALKIYGLTPPWKYWNVRDTRTAYDIFNFDPRSVKRVGTYHNALDDCQYQVQCVQRAFACRKD